MRQRRIPLLVHGPERHFTALDSPSVSATVALAEDSIGSAQERCGLHGGSSLLMRDMIRSSVVGTKAAAHFTSCYTDRRIAALLVVPAVLAFHGKLTSLALLSKKATCILSHQSLQSRKRFKTLFGFFSRVSFQHPRHPQTPAHGRNPPSSPR